MAKKEITPEMLEQYKGLLPCSAEARTKFSPAVFARLPEQLRPSITVRPLTRTEKTEYFTTQDADRSREIIAGCVVAVDNLRYADTGEVVQEMTVDVYASLHYEVINEIREQVMIISSLSDVERLGLT